MDFGTTKIMTRIKDPSATLELDRRWMADERGPGQRDAFLVVLKRDRPVSLTLG